MRFPLRLPFRPARWAVCMAAALSLTACGGGGSSGTSTTGTLPTTVTVGGSVSGLSESGLVLTDNGADKLSVPSGATSFTFSQALTTDATYDVAVATQPTGETCKVSSGSGTASADVTSVSVACTVNTYTIGGTVTGLKASGLVLADNGTDNLTVNSGASTFTFSKALAYGAKYDVTVATQPTGETCTVSAGTGTVSGTVNNVGVACTTNTYSISGSAKGLTAAGLKLQFYSTGTVQSVTPVASGSAPYTFSNVPYGTSIAMVIQSQPGWETCKKDSGIFSGAITGNVTGENLTCTAVTPPPPTAMSTSTALSSPYGVAVEASGNLIVGDTGANEVIEISSSGTVTALGTGASPPFSGPEGVAVDSHGNVIVADTGNGLIREIVATNGVVSSSSSVITLNDGGAATFNSPTGVAVDSAGNVYVADTLDNEIREIVATNGSVSASSTVVTLAGSTASACLDGNGASARFNGPDGIAVGPSGNLYVADSNNNVIRKITSVGPAGSNTVTTLAGGAGTCDSQSAAHFGFVDGSATTQALFADPTGVTVDSAGNVFVVDLGNNAVREVTPAGVVSTIAAPGNTTNGSAPLILYSFSTPFGIALGSGDTLYVGDTGDNQIVTLTP